MYQILYQMQGAVLANMRTSFSDEQLLALKVAHFVLFACLACVARVPPLAQPLLRVLICALALALLTEGLQHFASHREPSWFDVGIDMAGAGLGLLLAWAAMRLKLLRF